MATLLFVHGTGVRASEYARSLQRVQKEVRSRQLNLAVEGCLWGDPCGVKLNAGGASIPLYDATLSPGVVRPVEEEISLWGLLYQDPLYELRVLASAGGSAPAFVPGRSPPGQVLEGAIRQVVPGDDLGHALAALGIDVTAFRAARENVLGTAACREALQATPAALDPHRTAVARAVIAQGIWDARQQEMYPADLLDAATRDEAVRLLSGALGHATLSIPGWVGKQLFGLAQRLGVMNHVQRKRGAISDAAYPSAGDVLMYLARGAGIRDFIRARLGEVAPPVLLLGHSLGGIACVDLLVREKLPQVKLLVTVGSQAPFLYEINALPSLSYRQPLPGHFPPWLNIYDLRDFLSYVGGSIFPGKVQDVLVDSRQPFPESHSAYWANPATWKAVAAHWQGTTVKEQP